MMGAKRVSKRMSTSSIHSNYKTRGRAAKSKHVSRVALSTASINSTILNYRRLHGRTYHNFEGAEYWGPNDDTQLEGQDIK